MDKMLRKITPLLVIFFLVLGFILSTAQCLEDPETSEDQVEAPDFEGNETAAPQEYQESAPTIPGFGFWTVFEALLLTGLFSLTGRKLLAGKR
jgi:hypothetical protein